jgi:hypothetical protein
VQAAAQRDTTRVSDPPLLPAVFGGMLGSAAGGAGGATLAFIIADCQQSDDVCEGLAVMLGAGIGSTVGAALIAHLGAQLGGGSPSFGRTLLLSGAGLLVGGGAAILMSSVDDSGAGTVIAYTVGQGTLAGLGAALWQRREQP